MSFLSFEREDLTSVSEVCVVFRISSYACRCLSGLAGFDGFVAATELDRFVKFDTNVEGEMVLLFGHEREPRRELFVAWDWENCDAFRDAMLEADFLGVFCVCCGTVVRLNIF